MVCAPMWLLVDRNHMSSLPISTIFNDVLFDINAFIRCLWTDRCQRSSSYSPLIHIYHKLTTVQNNISHTYIRIKKIIPRYVFYGLNSSYLFLIFIIWQIWVPPSVYWQNIGSPEDEWQNRGPPPKSVHPSYIPLCFLQYMCIRGDIAINDKVICMVLVQKCRT